MSIRRNPIAYLALFIALGGTSYAAVTIPANSVGARQLKTGAVTDAKVRKHSLTSRAFAIGTLPNHINTPRIVTSGPKVPTGPGGACDGGVSAEGCIETVQASCNAGEHVLGGGYNDTYGFGAVTGTVVASEPSPPTTSSSPEGWTVAIEPTQNSEGTLTVYAICAST